MNPQETQWHHNPLELTPAERYKIDAIKQNTYYGTTLELKHIIHNIYRREFQRDYTIPDEIVTNPIISSGQLNKIFVNIDRLPQYLWEIGIEHEACELYFTQHQSRALEIVKELGLEEIMRNELYSPVPQHFAALYFELARAQELGVMYRDRAYIASGVGQGCITKDMRELLAKQPDLFAKEAAGHIFQLVGRDIVIDYLEKHPGK